MQRISPRHWWRIRPWRPRQPFYGSAGARHSRRPSRRNSPPLTRSPFRADFVPLTLPSPPMGERVAQGRRGAAEPYPELGEGVRQRKKGRLRPPFPITSRKGAADSAPILDRVLLARDDLDGDLAVAGRGQRG